MAGPQLTYTLEPAIALPGMMYGSSPDQVFTRISGESSAEIPFGSAVKYGAADGEVLLPTTNADKIFGVVVRHLAYAIGESGSLGVTGVKPGGIVSVLRRGQIWVLCEDAVAQSDLGFVRAVATPPEVLGSILPAADGTDTVDCQNAIEFLTSAEAAGLAVVDVDFTGALA